MFFRKTVRVVIKDRNMAFEVQSGTNLYSALISENVIPQGLCRGGGQCGKCKIKIVGKNIAKPTKKEQLVLAKMNLDLGYRLACQTLVKKDMVIDTSGAISDLYEEVLVASKQLEEEFLIDVASGSVSVSSTMAEEPTPQESFSNISVGAFLEEINPFSEKKEIVQDQKDGIFLMIFKKQIRYFQYSSLIEGISREGTISDTDEFLEYYGKEMLLDYFYNVLKLENVDRLILYSSEKIEEGEEILGTLLYNPFDMGVMPCERLSPIGHLNDFALFIRLLTLKGKNKLLISLDRLEDIFFMEEGKVFRVLPEKHIQESNMFSIAPIYSNPILDVSDDLKEVTAYKKYVVPDSIPLHVLLKVASRMKRLGLLDESLNIISRGNLSKKTRLEYIVKIAHDKTGNGFYLFRDREGELMLRQALLDRLRDIKEYVSYVLEIVEKNFVTIESIVIATPALVPELLENMLELEILPKEYKDKIMYSPSDSPVMAMKLFQEPDIRTYVQKNFGSYYVIS